MSMQKEYSPFHLANIIYENQFLMEGTSDSVKGKITHVYCERVGDLVDGQIMLTVNNDLQEVVDRFVEHFGTGNVITSNHPLSNTRTAINVYGITIRLIKVQYVRTTATSFYNPVPKLFLVEKLSQQLKYIILGLTVLDKYDCVSTYYANAFLSFRNCVTYRVISGYRDALSKFA